MPIEVGDLLELEFQFREEIEARWQRVVSKLIWVIVRRRVWAAFGLVLQRFRQLR